jgi:hypothetical protein
LLLEIEFFLLEREPIPLVVELTFALIEIHPLVAPLFGFLDRRFVIARRPLGRHARPSPERAVASLASRVVDQR